MSYPVGRGSNPSGCIDEEAMFPDIIACQNFSEALVEAEKYAFGFGKSIQGLTAEDTGIQNKSMRASEFNCMEFKKILIQSGNGTFYAIGEVVPANGTGVPGNIQPKSKSSLVVEMKALIDKFFASHM